MKPFDLNTENFILYAAKHYNNPSCFSVQDFNNYLKRFKYIKRLLRRYKKTSILNERLILNHIILLHNVFGEALLPMLFFKFEPEYWSELKTFLVFLNYLPNNYQISSSLNEVEITLDTKIINKLRGL